MQVYEIIDGNRVIFGAHVRLNEKNIIFGEGRDNILYLADGLDLGDSVFKFMGSRSLIFLGKNEHQYDIKATVFNDAALCIGEDNYFNQGNEPMHIILSEQKHFLMGSYCNFSFNVWVRNADPHLIYSAETKERLNPTKSVYIGDHVWLGQNVTLLKGTQIGSGSIVGAGAVVSGKKIPSNTIWAGNPARRVQDKVFWTSMYVHNWSERETEYYQRFETDEVTYEHDADSISFDELDQRLSACRTADDKLKILLALSKNQSKNRFAI